jgi:hypothetical protein
MVRVDRRHASRRRSAALASAALLCLPVLAACASAGAAAAPRPADSSSPAASSTSTPGDYDKPLLRCTSAQQSTASGSVRVLSVISPLTVHVTVGERIDLAEDWAPIRPDGTGVGQVAIRAGQQVICQSGNVQGRFTGKEPGQRLPLIITKAGHATIQIIEQYMANSPISAIIYIDATAGKAVS